MFCPVQIWKKYLGIQLPESTQPWETLVSSLSIPGTRGALTIKSCRRIRFSWISDITMVGYPRLGLSYLSMKTPCQKLAAMMKQVCCNIRTVLFKYDWISLQTENSSKKHHRARRVGEPLCLRGCLSFHATLINLACWERSCRVNPLILTGPMNIDFDRCKNLSSGLIYRIKIPETL